MLVYIVLLALLRSADSFISNITVEVGEWENGWTCRQDAKELEVSKRAYIAFEGYNHTLPEIKCESLRDTDKVLHMKVAGKMMSNTSKQYVINSVLPYMSDQWKCNVLPFGKSCNITFVVYKKVRWWVNINEKKVSTKEKDHLIQYEFYDDELVSFECGTKDSFGDMEITVEGAPYLHFTQPNVNKMTMLMKMRPKYNGTYITCYHEVGPVLSYVKVLLKRKTKKIDTGKREYDNKLLKEINMLRGLQPSNILFYFWKDCYIIHYGYDLPLHLKWTVSLSYEVKNVYKVTWKDTIISNLHITTAYNSVQMTLHVPPIAAKDDELSVINIEESFKPLAKIILHQTKPDFDPPHNYTFYILGGVLAGILVTISITVVWYMRRSKPKMPIRPVVENAYEHTYDDIIPFPPQWDTHAAMGRTEPDLKSIRGLYGLRFVERQNVRLNDDYTTPVGSDNEPFYHEIQMGIQDGQKYK